MKNRKLPFGYELKDGTIQINLTESECVAWIFRTYLAGSTYNDIAAELNSIQTIPYGKRESWNKNMIDRILRDQRYCRNPQYPQIIPEKLFQDAQQRRAERGKARKQTPAQRMIRILGGGRADESVEANILIAINRLIEDPNKIQRPQLISKDQTQRFRVQSELNMVLNQHSVEEDRAAQFIRALAEAEYDMIDNNEYETERLRRIFREAAPMDELSADLLQKTVAKISVQLNIIQLTMKNHQVIEVSDAT